MLHLQLLYGLILNICLIQAAFPLNAFHLRKRQEAIPVEIPAQSHACGDIVRNATRNTFKAIKVYECLISVPFNAAVASRFLKYYKDSLQFHSTLAYLKDPPASYQQQPVDLLAGIDRIQSQIDLGQFDNQYEFEASLQELVYAAHDDHLGLAAGILGVFTFGTSYRIVSVSSDGKELPKIYIVSDLVRSQRDGEREASAITTFDGEEVTAYLSRFAADNSIGGRESHTDWNLLLTSPAQVIQSYASIWGGGATFYPGENLVIGLENGTSIETPWYGVFHGDSETGPLETGGDFYNSFVLGWWPASYNPDEEGTEEEITEPEGTETETPTSPTASTMKETPTPTPTGPPPKWNNVAYPRPAIAQPDFGIYGGGSLSGYFLADDIAVLSIPTFQELGDAVDTFSATVTEFIAKSKKKGVKKVVIDLQRNYGGDALLATDTFRQFFPLKDPFLGSRLRAHNNANVLGLTITSYFNNITDDLVDFLYLYTNEWVSSTRLNTETNKTFDNWEEFYGPNVFAGDNFTTVQRYNLSDPIFDTLALEAYNDGFTVYGYGDRPATSNQPFAAEDIILLTDGVCSSTCSLFVEMMHHEAGVKTVVAGGRPSYGPMQSVGLSRGARSYGIDTDLDSDIFDAQVILDFNNKSTTALPNRTEELEFEIVFSTINLRDQIRKGDSVPLQFAYDAADCRIFFTPETVFNYTLLWRYAADAIWTNPSLCVKDSTGYATTKELNTKLPPAILLPPKADTKVVTLKKGAAIDIIFNPKSGIEASPGQKGGSNAQSTAVKPPFIAPKCDSDDDCAAWAYCDINYKFCSRLRPGEKIPRGGCVPRCSRFNGNDDCKGTRVGGACWPLPEDVENQLEHTGRGFCSSAVKVKKFLCGKKPVATSVQPGFFGKPVP